MFYSRASEALFLFIRLPLAGSVAVVTYPSKTAVGGIIKKRGMIKRFNREYHSVVSTLIIIFSTTLIRPLFFPNNSILRVIMLPMCGHCMLFR